MEIGWRPCKAKSDVWMKRNSDLWEYMAVYVDDLCIAAKDAESITKILVEKYRFKLKGVGDLTFHLGCDFTRDKKWYSLLCT